MNRRTPFWFAFVGMLCLAGCAGTSSQNGLALVSQVSIGTGGGVVASPDGAFQATFPPGALTRSVTVSIDEFNGEIGELRHDHWSPSARPMMLLFDDTALSDTAKVTIRMKLPSAKPDADEDSFLAVTDVDSSLSLNSPIILLDEDQTTSTEIIGQVDKTNIQRLKATDGFVLFSATRDVTLGTNFQSQVLAFKDGKFAGTPDDLKDKRVAIVVHGVMSSLNDVTSLGAFLSTVKQKDATGAYYDAVIGFNYSSNAPITDIGTALANAVKPLITNSKQVDVFAHSMGTLVSRYAIETTALANRIGAKVSHFVSLGGPHVGVPFADKKWYTTLMYFVPPDAKPCINDLMTVGKDGATLTPFLTNLNTATDSPDAATIQYFSMAGSDHNYTANGYNIGATVHYVYTQIIDNNVVDDGLVATYTAQSDTLKKRSHSWVAGPILPLSHDALHDNKSAFDQLQIWLNGWNS